MVTDRGGVIVCHLRPVTDEKSALVHTDEYVLPDVLRGDPVTKDERGYPDEPCPVQPEAPLSRPPSGYALGFL